MAQHDSMFSTPGGLSMPAGMAIKAKMRPGYERVLTSDALAFVADLARTFGPRVAELLGRRRERQARFDAGEQLDFLPETAAVRAGDWTVFPVRGELLDRRVEIIGPPDRRTVVNALNSGANVFTADFEDLSSPTWDNLVQGQLNLFDAVRGTIAYVATDTGKRHSLDHRVAVLFVRPRGLHVVEQHATVDGRPVPGAFFDFGLFFFHNAKEQLARGTAPYFYLPNMESYLEARLYNDLFVRAQSMLGIARGTIKATSVIETLPAAFEMDECLWELQEHSCGLHGRPAYAKLLVKTCHRRNVHAMGGMATPIPIREDPAANEPALDRVRTDKLREVEAGHDGTWVAHPGIVPIAKEVFDAHMPGPHQIRMKCDEVCHREDLPHPLEGSLLVSPAYDRSVTN